MDFFLRTSGNLVPVEVKATNGRSKTLSTLIKGEHYPDIAFGVKLTGGSCNVNKPPPASRGRSSDAWTGHENA